MPDTDSTITIPEDVLNLAPWSVSMAGLAVECSYAFDLRYRQRQKSKEAAPEAQTIGTVVHAVLENALQGIAIDRAFRAAIEAYDLTFALKEETLLFREAVEDFIRRIDSFCKQFKVKTRLPERKYAITPDFRPTGFFDKKGLFRGVADVTLITEDGIGVVLDHKTGAHKPLSMHQKQLNSYAVLLLAQQPNLREVRTGVHYVGGDPQPNGKRVVWANPHTAEVIRTRLRQELVEHLVLATRQAQSVATKRGWMCNFCGYKSICPEYQ